MRGRALALLTLLLALGVEAKLTLTVGDYITRLEQLHGAIAGNQLEIAKSAAAELAGSEIVSARGNFHADDSLLSAVREVRTRDRVLLTRIELAIAELRNASAAAEAAPDPKLLQRVAAEQEVPELAKGGELTAPAMPKVSLIESIFRSIGRGMRWIGTKIGQFWDWLRDFFIIPAEESGTTTGMRWIVISVVALIVIGIIFLAVEVIRRARRGEGQTLVSSAPLRSARDDDPLSRSTTEWERYAAQLAAEGRHREAIRAWYHAVLVTCYGTGVLHFRKGRTNWEYIAALPPSTAWRPDLIRLTQRFEQEWYGSLQSTEEALEECSARAKRILDALPLERGAA